MIEIKAPGDWSTYAEKKKIFLAGSIEMGKAVDWQDETVRALAEIDAVLLNPRRKDWDASWEPSIDNLQFREQVEWELSAIEAADRILMYFAPGTKSPITLLELGLCAASSPEKLLVCCPEGFWRKGNVDIVCKRYGVRQTETLVELIESVENQ